LPQRHKDTKSNMLYFNTLCHCVFVANLNYQAFYTTLINEFT